LRQIRATEIVATTPATRGNACSMNSWSNRISRRKSCTPAFSKPAMMVTPAMANMIGTTRGSLKKAATGQAAMIVMAEIRKQRRTTIVKAVS
jgi:hypothetical protein